MREFPPTSSGHILGLLIRPSQYIGNDVLLEHAAPVVIVDGAARNCEADRFLEAILSQFVVHILFDEFMGRHSGTHSFLALYCPRHSPSVKTSVPGAHSQADSIGPPIILKLDLKALSTRRRIRVRDRSARLTRMGGG
jgi:hypothetical protein